MGKDRRGKTLTDLDTKNRPDLQLACPERF